MVTVQPVDLGFAEFLTAMVGEAAEALLTAQADQEEKALGFLDTAESSVEDFASALDSEDVDIALADLLPGEQGGTSAVAGGPVPAPAVLHTLGLTLGADDVDGDGNDPTLTERGAGRVRAAVRLALARSRLAALRAVASRGLPRVVIDHGRVLAKVTLCPVRTGGDDCDDDDRDCDDDDDRDDQDRDRGRHRDCDDDRDEDDDRDDGCHDDRCDRCSDRRVVVAARRRSPTALQPTVRASMGSALRNVRLVAHSPTTSQPRHRGGVLGEVEITFRSVT